jgi:hypothetical protein
VKVIQPLVNALTDRVVILAPEEPFPLLGADRARCAEQNREYRERGPESSLPH